MTIKASQVKQNVNFTFFSAKEWPIELTELEQRSLFFDTFPFPNKKLYYRDCGIMVLNFVNGKRTQDTNYTWQELAMMINKELNNVITT